MDRPGCGAARAALLRWPASVACVHFTWKELPFLLAGVLAGNRVGLVEKVPPAAALMLAILLGVAIYFLTPYELLPAHWRFFPVGLLGTAMLFLTARAMAGSSLGRGFAWVGVASLGVYLLSAFGQGLGRQLLFAVHIRQPAVHLLSSTLLATVPTAWIYQHRVRLHLGWLFAWPWTSR